MSQLSEIEKSGADGCYLSFANDLPCFFSAALMIRIAFGPTPWSDLSSRSDNFVVCESRVTPWEARARNAGAPTPFGNEAADG